MSLRWAVWNESLLKLTEIKIQNESASRPKRPLSDLLSLSGRKRCKILNKSYEKKTRL